MIMEAYRSGHNGADSKSVSGATRSWVRIPPLPPTNCYQKDFMPTNGGTKPFVGINLVKNKSSRP